MRSVLTLATLAGALLLQPGRTTAQDRPIGYWRSHYPHLTAKSVATDGATLFTASTIGFFTYNIPDQERTTYSKVEGLSDVDTRHIGYDKLTGTTIITYENSNIDLFRNLSFRNIPDLRLKSTSGSKQVNNITTLDGFAYLSTDLGVVVLDLEREEVKETYAFSSGGQTLATRGFQAAGNYFYTATSQGLYRALKTHPNLQAISAWQNIAGTQNISGLTVLNNRIYALTPAGALRLNTAENGYDTVFASSYITHLDAGDSTLLISQFIDTAGYGFVWRMQASGGFTDTFRTGLARQAVELSNGYVWVSDEYQGLEGYKIGSKDKITINPPGPRRQSTFDILANNKEVYVAHGAYGDLFNPIGLRDGFSLFKNEGWSSYRFGDTTLDIVALAKDPVDGTIYAGSLSGGLASLKPDGSTQVLKYDGPLERQSDAINNVPVISLAYDLNGNLIVGQYKAAVHELAIRSRESGNWSHFTTPYSSAGGLARTASGLTVDDYNQIWYFIPRGGGVIVFDPATSASRLLSAGAGSGGLPSNNVLSMTRDRDGAIWIGTEDGIGIVSCPDAAIAGGCEAERRTVQYDQFAGYLFEGQQVNTIAVDGANRKWIGTNSGVWLISPDADSIVYRFTSENSPLPSNVVQKIGIDPVTGDVYIGTDNGLVSYRSTATQGGEVNENVKTYPNPVPSDYNGTIAIKGLVEDADVRITDISGQLVYRTRALGGQAIWNGRDYTGRRPQSGVYLVFITNRDGSQVSTGKLVFME